MDTVHRTDVPQWPPVSTKTGALYMTESLVELDENPDFLGRLKPVDRQRVSACGYSQAYRSGEYCFTQGQKHNGIYVIKTGLMRSFYASPGGREITLAYWTAGNFVGGPEVFGGGVHMWSSIAHEPSSGLWLPGANLRRLIIEIPELAIGLIDGLVHKGKCYSALLQLLGTRSMAKRLAHLLLTLANRHGTFSGHTATIHRRFTHEQLASMIGATRQWVSATMEKFERESLIGRHSGQIVIHDRARLMQRSL
jgi:CRP-like cAMP-binding protein